MRYKIMVWAAVLAFGTAVAGAAETAAPGEIKTTAPGLEMQPVTAECTGVPSPTVITVKVLGEVALIGVLPVPADADWYDDAVKFVKLRVDGKPVRLEVCPNIPLNAQGQNRALVYWRNGEKWESLNIALIKAGLGKVADVPGCHVPTKAWLQYEKEARQARLGLWKDFAPAGDIEDMSDLKLDDVP
jgi:hypothetical protein